MSVKLDYNKFFKVLEEAFCKNCPHYDKFLAKKLVEANAGRRISLCCKLNPFDRCLIYYLTGVDYEGWGGVF